MVCAFQGWNDAGDAASSAVSFLASALDARRFARIDSEEFYDFQANRPCVQFERGNTARDRLADGRGVRGARPESPARPRARPGRRAVDALARLQLAPRRPRRSARRAGGRLAGRAARRRAPHAPGDDDRVRLRSLAGGAPGNAELHLRGTHGDRRRPAQRLRGGGAAVGEPVGGRPPLRRGRRQPEGGAGAGAQAGRPDRGLGRRLRPRVGRRRLRAPGGARRAERPRHPGVRRTAGAGRRERRGERSARTFPPETSSPANSSAFCASGGPRGS